MIIANFAFSQNRFNKITILLMTSVYFNDLAISFTDNNISNDINSRQVSNRDDIYKFAKELNEDKFEYDIVLHGYKTNKMFNDFCLSYKYIEAAGGVVINNKSEYLLIKRFDIWDLPKGKVEKNETTHEAAIREVCEETGLQDVKIIEELPDTHHIYKQKGAWFLKRTYWYIMSTHEDTTLIPQTKEAITDAIWMDKNKANTALSKSYRSLYDNLGYLFK